MNWSWVPVAFILAAMGVYLFVKLFGGGDKAKTNWLDDATRKAEDIKAAADAALVVELAEVRKDRDELNRIEEITDDTERLEALAAYANRKRS